jgi:uncharacterized RDD family membrane protein YckC
MEGPAASLEDYRYDGVRTRRVLAFMLDYAIVVVLIVAGAVALAFLGLVTFGAAWLLYPLLGLGIAILYVGATLGGPNQATPGMRFFSLRIARDDGQAVDFLTAVLHGLIFWAAHAMLTPLLLAVSLFSARKRLVHDMFLGVSIVRADA